MRNLKPYLIAGTLCAVCGFAVAYLVTPIYIRFGLIHRFGLRSDTRVMDATDVHILAIALAGYGIVLIGPLMFALRRSRMFLIAPALCLAGIWGQAAVIALFQTGLVNAVLLLSLPAMQLASSVLAFKMITRFKPVLGNNHEPA